MDTKEFYQSFISIIDYIAYGNIGVVSFKGDIFITQSQYLNPIHEDCSHSIKGIEKQEYDRNLDNKTLNSRNSA